MSALSQSAAGSRFVERMPAVVETCRRRGINAFAWLTKAMRNHYRRKTAELLPLSAS
jgi:hypothetical protein